MQRMDLINLGGSETRIRGVDCAPALADQPSPATIKNRKRNRNVATLSLAIPVWISRK